MIPQALITDWRREAPWAAPDQVEHDLVLSRAICELYNNPIIAKNLAFRGGTAIHKIFFNNSGRFSEDLDFVQTKAEPIGETVNAIRDCLDYWLGQPSWKQSHGRFTFFYKFITEIEPIITRKVKLEINTREHFHVEPYKKVNCKVDSRWYQSAAMVVSFTLEELLATKLRALYQRKKGRDLYDLWFVLKHTDNLNLDRVIRIFQQYMTFNDTKVTRAEFEKNLTEKREDIVFNRDIKPLLSTQQVKVYSSEEAYDIVSDQFLSRLPGDAWKAH